MARPFFKPTDKQRADVELWTKSKVSIAEIARRLGLMPKTLRKHFANELGLISTETVKTVLDAAKPRAGGGYRPTEEQREMVLILAGAKWPYEEIALELGVSQDVLEEHFADQLRDGPVKFSSRVIRAMWHAAQGGNVAAAKICLVMNAGASAGGRDTQTQPSREGLKGKKELAAIGAQNAEQGTDWESLVNLDKPN